jgi:hypothetical protein
MQREETVIDDEESVEDQEGQGEFDQENPQEEEDTVTYQLVTQTFDGTEIPPGVIPENATDIQITTTTEGQ